MAGDLMFPRGNLYTENGTPILRALDIQDWLADQGIKLSQVKGDRALSLPSGGVLHSRITKYGGRYHLRLLCQRCGGRATALYEIEPGTWVCNRHSKSFYDPTGTLGLDTGRKKDAERYQAARLRRLERLSRKN